MADKTFTAATNSPVIAAFQKLVNEDGSFPWSEMVEQKEMRFVYDMLSAAETTRDFIPSTAQGRWAAQILIKLKAAEKHWNASLTAKTKGPSQQEDRVARRQAKEHLKRQGRALGRKTPSDVELVQMLNSVGAIATPPTRKTAKMLLITWSEGLTKNTSSRKRSNPKVPPS